MKIGKNIKGASKGCNTECRGGWANALEELSGTKHERGQMMDVEQERGARASAKARRICRKGEAETNTKISGRWEAFIQIYNNEDEERVPDRHLANN